MDELAAESVPVQLVKRWGNGTLLLQAPLSNDVIGEARRVHVCSSNDNINTHFRRRRVSMRSITHLF